ncbi:MAG: MBOAT family O-acyltransferase [Patescibacteria group bacterium]
MVFSSIIFIYLFLPIFLIIYFSLGKKYKNFFILLASLLFYFWGEGAYVLLMLAVALLDYSCGLMFAFIRSRENFSDQKKDKISKSILVISIIGNLSILGFYKYFNFGIDQFNSLLQIFGFSGSSLLYFTKIILPLGISFYTFQSMSYTIDVYRKRVPACKSVIDYLCFVTLFPQLVAGPIVRYIDVSKELISRKINYEYLSTGVKRFIIGLAKKVIIANNVGAVADKIFSLPSNELSFGLSWLGAVCYALQIFFDFSGYSDMAIGLGKMIGFNFLENFNYPYISKSIRDFWRRWHISLSTWFRDYLYIPLGGNKVGVARGYFNLFIVFFLCGLWHGASWLFIIWGCWHGLFLVLERTSFGKMLSKAPSIFQHIYVLLIILIGWVLFRAENVSQALDIIKNLFGFNGLKISGLSDYVNNKQLLALVIGVLFSTPIFIFIKNIIKNFRFFNGIRIKSLLNASYSIFLLLLFVLCSISISDSTYNPFIYFHF